MLSAERPAGLHRRSPLAWLGGVATLLVAAVVYSRPGINGDLSRDESIYAYAGQQLAHGVPPYVSIFDPKGPLASMIAGAAAWLAQLAGRNDLYAVRLAFFGCSCLTVVALYLLAIRLWGSVTAAVVTALVFVSFRGFALDALAGPDAKTPGVMFAVVTMLLLCYRRWYWSAFAAALTCLVWQPNLVYPIVALVVAVALADRGCRWRALALSCSGIATPVLLTGGYFLAVGAFGKLVEAAVVFPLVGINRGGTGVVERVHLIYSVVLTDYGLSGVLFLVGITLLVGLTVARLFRRSVRFRDALRDPMLCVVLTTFLGTAAYALADFQGYPDLFPLLPYGALGLGMVTAVVLSPLPTTAEGVLAAALVIVLTALSAWTGQQLSTGVSVGALRLQRADACALERVNLPGTPIYSVGSPVPLVLTHRANPDRFIYLASDVDKWKVDHTPGGLAGWTGQIQDAHPSTVVFQGFRGDIRKALYRWFVSAGYHKRYLGEWRVWLTKRALKRAPLRGVEVTRVRTLVATDTDGTPIPVRHCG